MLCIFCMNEIDDASDKCAHCGQSQSVTIPPHRLMPHTVLAGRYIVGAAKGEGGFGITYVGKDTRLDRTVAIKEYYPTGLVNRNSTVSPMVTQTEDEHGKDAFEKGRERFLTEAKTLAKFSSEPGIVHILDFFVENNTAYIVMEYLDGMSLSNKLKSGGTMTPDEALTALMPVMISLEKVHKQGLIHRDISPSNIMILEKTVKLIDFGAARHASGDGNRSISLMLKPGYAPEEQYRSKGVQGPWTDVYALCATIYKCITGVTPDEANDRLHKDELKTPSQLGISVDPRFESALMKGMSVMAENRYQSIEELLKAISPFAISGGKRSEPVSDDGRTVLTTQEDQSTRYVHQQQSSQRQPVVPMQPVQPVQNYQGYQQNVQSQQFAPQNYNTQPQTYSQQFSQQPQTYAQQTYSQPFSQQPYTQPQTQYTGQQYANRQFAQPQPQQFVQPQFPQAVVPQGSDIDAKIAERMRKRRNKKTLFAFIAIVLIAAAIVIAVLVIKHKSSNTMTKKEGEQLEPVSFSDTDAKLNFSIDDDYVHFSKTVITPNDIAQIKSRKTVSSVYISQCQIPQETMNVLWELDGQLTYLSINESSGFDDISPLSKLTTLHSLSVEKCDLSNSVFKDLDLSKMTDLYSINLMGNPSLTDINFLKTSQTASSVDISYCEVSDISPIKDMSRLYTFKAENCRITDISALKDKSVSTVYLSENSVKDISALGGNKSLHTLDLSNNEIESIKPLEDCQDLKSLNLNHNHLKSLDGLQKLIRLEKFECSHNEITDLSCMSNLTVLYYVNLSSNKISDITLLEKSKDKLKSVFIDDCLVTDLSPVGKAEGLVALSFNNNQITSIDSIKNCTKLKALSGDGNKISSLDAVANMTALRCLSFAHNKISDMSPVRKMTSSMKDSMYVLDLSSNNISELALTGSKTYEAVLVYNNPLKSLDSVKNIQGMNIAISYFDGIDLKEISKGYLRLSIVDCPLDKQVAIEDEVGRYAVTFCTAKEKEDDTNQKKEYVFKQVNS